uniref:Peroxisomal membrane protein MPV17 n=1 Tax=Bigelowiella natans TaxID=227086 RepID=A0A6U1IUE3_BIGNA|mmetsp:Transcript_9743/g.11644  ORF Transcript_9743/g.11644 Transcript_9743/m.11644 type:complete len:184 (-) Transcript_9743:335-886(-)|eukprot:jgi/Bigna1/55945/estExt_Genewise1Plus.C_760033
MSDSYAKLLKTRPILTKALTAGTLSGLGDIIAGLLITGSVRLPPVLQQALIGVVLKGPYFHYVFQLVGKLFAGYDHARLSTVLKKMLVTQGVFSPLFLFLYLTSLRMLQGKELGAALAYTRKIFPAVLTANLKFWPVVDLLSFSFVPNEYRVLFANLAGLIWTVYLVWKTRQLSLRNSKKKHD